jgi:hypothetical protein
MESPIEELIEKYWNGETTLSEEKRVKDHFKINPALSKESEYFRFLKKEQEVTFDKKVSKNSKKTWLSAAATIAVGLITAALVLQESNKDPFAIDDPEQALEETKRALMMIGLGLNEGQSYAMELTKINKAKDELKEESEAL